MFVPRVVLVSGIIFSIIIMRIDTSALTKQYDKNISLTLWQIRIHYDP